MDSSGLKVLSIPEKRSFFMRKKEIRNEKNHKFKIPMFRMGENIEYRQSARLFLQSSELRLPHPLTRRRVCFPLLWFRGRDILACGRRGGGA